MIRYDPHGDVWLSAKNSDENGMPTSDLTGDPDVCVCHDCDMALLAMLGSNFSQLPE